MLTVIEKVVLLQEIDDLADIPTEQLGHIAAIAEEIHLDSGVDFLKQDEPAEALYLILEGRVRLHRDGREILVAPAKEVIGVWSLFDSDQPNIATATTLEPTGVLRISREAFYEIVADYVEITQGIFTSLARRLRRMGQQILETPGKETPS